MKLKISEGSWSTIFRWLDYLNTFCFKMLLKIREVVSFYLLSKLDHKLSGLIY